MDYRKMRAFFRRCGEYAALAAILLVLIGGFSAATEHFLSAATFGSIINRLPTLMLVTLGMTLVLIVGAIDLSVGSVAALASSALGAALIDWRWPLPAAAALAIAVGALAGLFNGCVAVKLRVPSFIVTLGTLEMARGLAYLIAHSQTKYLGGRMEAFARPLGGWLLTPLAWLALAAVGIGQLALSMSVPGRWTIATGSNEEAARFSGIRTGAVKIAVFIATGSLAGAAAICQSARLGAVDPNAGLGLELSAIAAAVIGGVSLSGGRGSVVGAFLGVLIIAVLEAGLAQVGASDPVKHLVTGGVIVAAASADLLRKSVA